MPQSTCTLTVKSYKLERYMAGLGSEARDGWMEAKKEIDFMAQHKREGGGKGKEKDGRRDPQQLNVM